MSSRISEAPQGLFLIGVDSHVCTDAAVTANDTDRQLGEQTVTATSGGRLGFEAGRETSMHTVMTERPDDSTSRPSRETAP